jgi:hypothetical protein
LADLAGWAGWGGEPVFAVDYRACRRCRIGWVERPRIWEPYRRCDLAGSGLLALRADHPSPIWHTLGGHFGEFRPFWRAVGRGVPGGYQQGLLCPHVTRG